MDLATGRVRTVLGDLDPKVLGHVQPHEHLLCDMSAIVRQHRHELAADERALADEPIALGTYDWIRRNVLNVDNLRLTSEDDAVREVARYRRAGGGTLVDSTSVGLGRDPLGCAGISRATGVHVVVGSGFYVRDCHPPYVAGMTAADIEERITTDLTDQIDGTGVRSGLIGEIGLSWPVHPVEERVLAAAARVQARTGAPLQIHPGRHPDAPLHALRMVDAAGGDPSRTVISHVDRTLWEQGDILALARTGCYVELDLFGQEASYYAFNPDARRPNDATRIDWLTALAERGHGDRLLVSQDICQKVYLRAYGGPGYTHILDHVVPQMRRMGLTAADITALTVTNPAQMLTWRQP